jgi:hypothetical protein
MIELNRVGFYGAVSIEWEDNDAEQHAGAKSALANVRRADLPPQRHAPRRDPEGVADAWQQVGGQGPGHQLWRHKSPFGRDLCLEKRVGGHASACVGARGPCMWSLQIFGSSALRCKGARGWHAFAAQSTRVYDCSRVGRESMAPTPYLAFTPKNGRTRFSRL